MTAPGLDRRQRRVLPTAPEIERVLRSDPGVSTPHCSVMITTRNQATFVVEAVASVLAQETDTTYEVIVVDDASTDETPALIREMIATARRPLVYARLRSQVGPAGGRNAAMSLARGEILAFTDSDCIADRRWLDEMIRAFADPHVGVVQEPGQLVVRAVLHPLGQHRLDRVDLRIIATRRAGPDRRGVAGKSARRLRGAGLPLDSEHVSLGGGAGPARRGSACN